MLIPAIIALVAIAALAVTVRGSLLVRAGRRELGRKWMMLGAALLVLSTVILILAQD